MFGITSELLIIIGSSLAAALSFAAFVFPMLQRSEKKEHFRNTIEKKKKELFHAAKENLNKKGDKTISAKESVAIFFKVQQFAGDFGKKVRAQLILAGIRGPMAPVFYMGAQIGLPILFFVLSMLVLSSGDDSVSNGTQFFVLIGAVLSGFFMPRLLIKNKIEKRQEDFALTFPDALDMMLICVQGGIGLEQTVERIAEEMAEHSPVLAEELGVLSAEMAMLDDRRLALNEFGKRVGGFGKTFATALIQAEQYGTSVSQVLRVMSMELRDIRMSNAELKAASLPPKLTVPMILFFLPALFIVILGPASIQASSAGVGGG